MQTLGILSEWQYRTVAIEISQRGYRKKEPAPAQRESSQVFSKVSAALREDGISKGAIAAELDIPVQEIEQLVFGLLVTGVAGTAAGGKSTGRARPKLYFVQ
jgi:hypothetical protein